MIATWIGTRAWTLVLVALAGFMTALDALVVATALPAIQRSLHASVTSLAWTVNAFQLTLAAGIVTAAALGDRWGRRRSFAAGLLLFVAASAACALAPSAGLLIAARAVQGLGVAAVSPLSLTMLAVAFPPERRGAVIGVWGGVTGLAVAAGPLVGGALTQGLSWHWVFWVNVPIGVAVSLLAMLRLPESRGPATHFDLPAVALVSGGATALAWGLIDGRAVLLLPGAALLAAFLVWEARAPEPMLPLRLFRSRSFTAASASGLLMSASLMPAAVLIAQYLQLGLGGSPLEAGLRFLPMTATPLLIAPLAGLVADRIGSRPLMAAGLLAQALGLLWLAALATPGQSYTAVVPPLALAGAVVSMPMATTATAALNAVVPADLGKAAGAANTLRQFGGAMGVALAAAVIAAHGHLGSPAAFDAGLRPPLATAAGVSALGALAALAVPARPRLRPTPSLVAAND